MVKRAIILLIRCILIRETAGSASVLCQLQNDVKQNAFHKMMAPTINHEERFQAFLFLCRLALYEKIYPMGRMCRKDNTMLNEHYPGLYFLRKMALSQAKMSEL